MVMRLTQRARIGKELVGGKGASLAEIAFLGLAVPQCFAITTNGFREFCRYNGIVASADTNPEIVLAGAFPPVLERLVRAELDVLSNDVFAVRSSATVEDSKQYSLAGQLDTFLNVPRADVLSAVKRCWASLFARRAKTYLGNLPSSEFEMAVVVQRQIDPAWAGVAFSLDPLTQACDELVVEWTTGLGEKVVNGDIVPNQVTLSRAHPNLAKVEPAALAAHLANLHRQVLSLEKHFACLVDVEWCATPAQLWILQARPITTVGKEGDLIWSNVNLSENFPAPLVPLAWSFIRRFYAEYMRATLRLFGWSEREFVQVSHLLESLTGLHGGRVYYNLSSWYGLISYFPRAADLQRFMNVYIGQDVPIASTEDSAAPELRRQQQSLGGTIRLFLSLIHSFRATSNRIQKLETHLANARRGWRTRLETATDPRDVLSILDEIVKTVVEQWAGPCGSDLMVMVIPSLLSELIARWSRENPKEILPALLQGISVVSDEPSRLLWQLSRVLMKDDPSRSASDLRATPPSAEGLRAEASALLVEFMTRFGSRCYNDCSLYSPTFEERPDLVWQLVAQFAGVPDRLSEQARRPLMLAREQALSKFCATIPFPKAAMIRLLANASVKAIQNREAGRLQQSILFGEIRRALLRMAVILMERRILGTEDDVFFCTLEEVAALARNAYPYPAAIGAIIEARRAHRQALMNEVPPSLFVLRAGEILPARMAGSNRAASDAEGSAMRGLGVSRGTVRGRACVLRDPSSGETLNSGDILVAPSTDPGWSPLFMLAGGLVLERGGLLSHGAIVAREMGIPAIVGVKDACSRIPSGTFITLDADAGVVELELPD